MHSLLCLLHFLLCLLHLQQFKPQTNVTKRRRAELNPREVHVRLFRSIRGRKTKTPHSPAFAPCALWLRARSAGYGRHHPRMCNRILSCCTPPWSLHGICSVRAGQGDGTVPEKGRLGECASLMPAPLRFQRYFQNSWETGSRLTP